MRQLARYKGPFGRVRIFERTSDGARAFATGGSLQTLVDRSGTSLFGYVHALKLLLKGRRHILMLGGGGGSLANMLVKHEHEVLVVDIDPMAERVAKTYFSLDPRVRWLVADGLNFPAQCQAQFDAVIVDACTAEGTHEGFMDSAWIAFAMNLVKADGALMINIAHQEEEDPQLYSEGFQLAEDMSPFGFHCSLLRPQSGWEGNEIFIVSRTPGPENVPMTDIMQRPAEVRSYLLSLKLFRLNAPAS